MQLQIFPAKLTRADGTEVRPVRVLTMDGLVQAFAWNDDTNDGDLVASWPIDDVTAGDGRTFIAPDGATISHDRGCGCGHPLKGWRPQPARTGT